MRLFAAAWLAGCLGLRVDTRVELVNQTELDLSLVVLEVAGDAEHVVDAHGIAEQMHQGLEERITDERRQARGDLTGRY